MNRGKTVAAVSLYCCRNREKEKTSVNSVMVVEDNEIIREDITETVNSINGFCVTCECPSGKDAVLSYLPGSFSVVLMDIEMETSHAGIDAARAIIEKDPQAKIVFLTSHDDDEIVITAMASGAKDFLVKGCSWEEISSHLSAVINGETILDRRVHDLIMNEYRRLSHSERSLLYFIQHLSSLTKAERELIGCFLDGMKIREIAQKRFVEPVTVKSQIRTLLGKLDLSRTSEIVSKIRELGLEHLFSS